MILNLDEFRNVIMFGLLTGTSERKRARVTTPVCGKRAPTTGYTA